jgi:hypothetical protein
MKTFYKVVTNAYAHEEIAVVLGCYSPHQARALTAARWRIPSFW